MQNARDEEPDEPLSDEDKPKPIVKTDRLGSVEKTSYGGLMMTDSAQGPNSAKKFRVGPLGTLNQVLTANAKVIRAMASGEIDSHLGARLSNAISIQRQIIEAIMTERLEQRLLTVEEALAGRISAHHEARHGSQSLPH